MVMPGYAAGPAGRHTVASGGGRVGIQRLTSLFRESRTAVLGPGRYETLHLVGEIDEVPVVTFTASWEHCEIDVNAPAAAYVKTIANGLAESHGWETDEICDYLLDRPGTKPTWTRQTLRTVIDDWTPGEQVPATATAAPATAALAQPR